MISAKTKIRLTVLLGLIAITLGSALVTQGQTAAALPNPTLVFLGSEPYEANGKSWLRYRYAVANREALPDSLFAASPELSPCGTNTKASRTWVDFFDSRGKRLYGFCALGKSADLAKIWFAAEADAIPPSWVYIELNDRQTSTKMKSGLVETTQ
ncbi:MAG: hypothetical protein ACR2H6_01415 [Pyrinomonadaceae bacterium]